MTMTTTRISRSRRRVSASWPPPAATVSAAAPAAQIDARVDATRDFLFNTYPGTRDLESRAYGVL